MIHPTSFISPSAQIAEDVIIGPFCHIGEGVVIKSGCELAAHVIIRESVTLQENVKIFSYAKIGNDHCSVEIGKHTHIREFCLIGTQNDSDHPLTIEEGCFIMAYVQVYPGCTIETSSIITNLVTLKERVTLEEKVIVGGLSTIEQNNTIGTGVMIGGASYITHDMPPYCLVEGNRATIKGLNNVGLRRRFENKKDIEAIRTSFKKIFREGIDKKMAEEIAKQSSNVYATKFARFIATSNI